MNLDWIIFIGVVIPIILLFGFLMFKTSEETERLDRQEEKKLNANKIEETRLRALEARILDTIFWSVGEYSASELILILNPYDYEKMKIHDPDLFNFIPITSSLKMEPDNYLVQVNRLIAHEPKIDKVKIEKEVCDGCGAPITGPVCEYCGRHH